MICMYIRCDGCEKIGTSAVQLRTKVRGVSPKTLRDALAKKGWRYFHSRELHDLCPECQEKLGLIGKGKYWE